MAQYTSITSTTTTTLITKGGTKGGAIKKITIANFSDHADGATINLFLNDGTATDLYLIKNCRIPKGATLVLEDVWSSAPAELQQIPASEKKLFCTPNIYNAYYSSLTAVASAGAVDYAHSMAQAGRDRLFYRGVEIVPMYEWDTALTALTGADIPPLFTAATAGIQCANGVIYAAKDNLLIGTNVTDPDNQLKMFYDEVSDNMYIRSNFTMGFQYGWDSLVNGSMLVD